MKKLETIEQLKKSIIELKHENKSIGFVPTMGFLHEGHLSLIKKARENHDIVVLSIFVNPLQFGPNEDFERYPRDIHRDEQLALESGVDVLFAPTLKEMYPHSPSIKMKAISRVDVLCGKKREGHFDGVVTVLTKLFHLVQPDAAYFGQKDAQQVAVVEALVKDLNFPLQIISVPTVREENGLAKSSRNVYLTNSEKQEAPQLYRSLQYGVQAIENGERDPFAIVQMISTYLNEHTSGEVDYIEVYSYPSLEAVNVLQGNIIIAIAVQFQSARLIDNIIIEI
ncbi:pantoate--beta-alanine ligase [Bacillus spongiae]|uniref:Pantothenate synthetase n=1 Tax=Bacillus spongiae TaxID=2683610 RepID=A0ABU8HDK1_9BACI